MRIWRGIDRLIGGDQRAKDQRVRRRARGHKMHFCMRGLKEVTDLRAHLIHNGIGAIAAEIAFIGGAEGAHDAGMCAAGVI